MNNLSLLISALTYIEENLTQDVKTDDIATACCASKSLLEKSFRYFTNFSVHDYIIRRRMMKASRLMIENSNLSLLDVAIEYG